MQLTHWMEPAPPAPRPHVRALAISPEPSADDCKKYKRRLCTFYEEVCFSPKDLQTGIST